MTHDYTYTFPLHAMPTAAKRPESAAATRVRSRNEAKWRLATSGDLALFPIEELLAALRSERASGVLTILSTAGTAQVRFSEGRLVTAKIGRLSGARATDKIQQLRSGLFHLRPTERHPGAAGRPRARLQRRGRWVRTPLRIHQPDVDDSNVVLLPATQELLNRFRDGDTIEACVASGDIHDHEVAALISLIDVGVLRAESAAEACTSTRRDEG